MNFSKIRPVAGLVLTAALASAPVAGAGFQVVITEDNSTALRVVLNGTPTAGSPMTINYSSPVAGNPIPDFTITGLTITSNSSVNPSTSATLTVNGSIMENNNAAHTLSIRVTDDGFFFPAPPNYTLQSTASDTNTFTTASDKHTFQSFADPNDAPFGMTVPSPTLSFDLDRANANTATPTSFLGTGLPYSISDTTILALAAQDVNAQLRTVNITGGTTVVSNDVVPEPASVVMMGLGVLGVLGLARARRRRDA